MARRDRQKQQDLLPLLWDDDSKGSDGTETTEDGSEELVIRVHEPPDEPDDVPLEPPHMSTSPNALDDRDESPADLDGSVTDVSLDEEGGAPLGEGMQREEDGLEETAADEAGDDGGEEDEAPWFEETVADELPDEDDAAENTLELPDDDIDVDEASAGSETDDMVEDDAETDGGEESEATLPTGRPGNGTVLKLDELPLSVGEALLEARSARGLTIPQASQQTKISASFIRTIEADEFQRLPGAFYVEKHVVSLCREYGIDAEPLLTQIRERLGESAGGRDAGQRMMVTTGETDANSRVQYRVRTGHEPITPWLSLNPATVLVGTVTLVVLVILIAFAVHQLRLRAENKRATVTEIIPVDPDGTPVEVDTDAVAPVVDFEDFIVPQELPMKELAVPGH